MRFLVISNSTHCFTSSVELPSVSCNQTSAIASPPCYQMPYQASLLSLVLLASPRFSPLEPIEHFCSRFAAIFSPSQNKFKKNYKQTNCTSSSWYLFACKNSSPQEIFLALIPLDENEETPLLETNSGALHFQDFFNSDLGTCGLWAHEINLKLLTVSFPLVQPRSSLARQHNRGFLDNLLLLNGFSRRPGSFLQSLLLHI